MKMRYLLPALLLLACSGDSDPTGPEEPDVLRVEVGWTFDAACQDRATLFVVEEVSFGTLTGTQFDQSLDLGNTVTETPATSRVTYSGQTVTYSEDPALEVVGQPARTVTLERDGDGYSADPLDFCAREVRNQLQHVRLVAP